MTQFGGYLDATNQAGVKMKSTSNLWISPNNADNSSNFTGLPGGFREITGEFKYITRDAYFWSSSEMNHNVAYHRQLSSSSQYLENWILSGFPPPKKSGMSIRCLRD